VTGSSYNKDLDRPAIENAKGVGDAHSKERLEHFVAIIIILPAT